MLILPDHDLCVYPSSEFIHLGRGDVTESHGFGNEGVAEAGSGDAFVGAGA